MTEQDVARLAKQIGIDPAEAINAFKAEQEAYAQHIPIYKWQRANQEQATILMRIHQQNELNIQGRE
jgi:hypothetical protein